VNTLKHMLHSLIALVLASLFSAPLTMAQGADAPDEQKVDRLFAAYNKRDSPGCALGVIRDGRFVYKRGYGTANLDYEMPITSATVFYIGSTSKQFTAMSIAILARKGKLSLDDPIQKFLPELPNVYKNVTITHLLHHTSGIRDYLVLISLSDRHVDDVLADEDVLRLLARQRALNFPPGEGFLYSNSNYFLLADVVERVSGKSLREFAEESIFKPLGMNHTIFHDDRSAIIKLRAAGYTAHQDGSYGLWSTNFERVGDGGVMTSVEDLFQWDQDFYHNRLNGGDPGLLPLVHTQGKLNSGETLDYSFGLFEGEYKGLKTVRHGGAFLGFKAELLRFPEQNFSVICLCNAENIDSSRLSNRVADIYLAGQFKQEEKKEATAAELEKPVSLSLSELQDLTGTYRDATTGLLWKIVLKDGKLTGEVANSAVEFVPLSASHFHMTVDAGQLDLVFSPKEPGEPREFKATPEDGPSRTFVAFNPPMLTSEQEAQIAGDYYSPELNATYALASEDGQLLLKRRTEVPAHVLPMKDDEFSAGSMTLKMERDSQHHVTGFILNAARITGLRFIKRQPGDRNCQNSVEW
jgi:CubicO group peptidase (beta-lactamase class C family)